MQACFIPTALEMVRGEIGNIHVNLVVGIVID